jgi:N-methylhydantoinase B/oxoprolinase/acetone carboxylase alpha subunit
MKTLNTQRDQSWIDGKRSARMGAVDDLPADVRALVHEYGLNVVKSIMDCGVTRAARIRHIVETVLDEFSPTRGSKSAQGPREYFREHYRGPAE